MAMRIGFGYDSHRFLDGDAAAAKPLVLGGVVFKGERALAAHSDGDVVIHAVIDALLGAATLGDIGSHFPDSDEKWRDADSATMLEMTVKEVSSAGYAIGNVDVTVICERPKISPLREEIRSRLASLLGISVAQISVKGKTNEKMDDVGAGLGIEAHAVALLT